MKKIKFYFICLFAFSFISSASFCGSENTPKSSSSTEVQSGQNESEEQPSENTKNRDLEIEELKNLETALKDYDSTNFIKDKLGTWEFSIYEEAIRNFYIFINLNQNPLFEDNLGSRYDFIDHPFHAKNTIQRVLVNQYFPTNWLSGFITKNVNGTVSLPQKTYTTICKAKESIELAKKLDDLYSSIEYLNEGSRKYKTLSHYFLCAGPESKKTTKTQLEKEIFEPTQTLFDQIKNLYEDSNHPFDEQIRLNQIKASISQLNSKDFDFLSQEIKPIESIEETIKKLQSYCHNDSSGSYYNNPLQANLYQLIFDFCAEDQKGKADFFNENIPYDIDSIRNQLDKKGLNLIGQLNASLDEIKRTKSMSIASQDLIKESEEFIKSFEKETFGIKKLEIIFRESTIDTLIYYFNEFNKISQRYAENKNKDINYEKTINEIKKLIKNQVLNPIKSSLEKLKNKKLATGYLDETVDFIEIENLLNDIKNYRFPNDHPEFGEASYSEILEYEISKINKKLRS